jgi:hypothetical protein
VIILLLALLSPAFAATPASVVTSKEWKALRNPRVDEFIGSVRYKSGPSLMTADWARYEHESGDWAARGRVHVERQLKDGATAVADGDRAFFNEKTRDGRVLPQEGRLLQFERRVPDQGSDFGEGRRLDWRDEKNAELTGEVRLWGPRYRAWADRADWRGPVLTLLGSRPVLERVSGDDFTGALKADKVIADKEGRLVHAEGSVVGWLKWPKKK